MVEANFDRRRDLMPPNTVEGNLPVPDILPDTVDLLELLRRPELMEHLDQEGIHRISTQSGYERRSFGHITLGFTRKLGDEYKSAPSAALLLTKDQKVMYVSFGTSGYYNAVVVGDASVTGDREVLRDALSKSVNSRLAVIAVSKKVRLLMDDLGVVELLS